MQLIMDTSWQSRRSSVKPYVRHLRPVCLQQGATNDPAEGQTDKDANDSSKAGLLGSVSRLLAPRNCLAAAASLARTAMPSSHGQLLQPARAALSLRLWLPHPRASISQMRTSTMKASLPFQ